MTFAKFFDEPGNRGRFRDVIPAMKRALTLSLRFLAGLAAGMAIALHAADAPKAGDYETVGFDRLASYTFTPPDYDPSVPNAKPPSGADQIPAKIKALDQQKVAVTGYMLPTKMDGGLVKEFLLVKDPMMCCYGVVPNMNEWIVVKMVKGGVRPLMDTPVSFYGELKVGAMFENGYMTGIYLLEGEKMGELK